MLDGVTLFRYRFALTRPLIPDAGSVPYREGLLLQWHTGKGELWSEVCPLPGFSRESLCEAQNQLVGFLDTRVTDLTKLSGFEDRNKLVIGRLYPSVQFGLEMGLFRLFDSGTELSTDTASPPAPVLPVAGLITGPIDHPQNYQMNPVVKIKVGRLPLNGDIDRVGSLLEQSGPEKTIRLDANQCWTLDQVSHFFSLVPREQIEFIEEPLKDRSGYRHWQTAQWPGFAFDEQVQHPDFSIRPCPGLSAIVVKPMLIGLGRSLDLVRQARQNGVRAIISSSYESSLTLNFLYDMATRLTPDSPPGLGTFQDNTCDLIEPCRLPANLPPRPLADASHLEKVADYGLIKSDVERS
ncbi:MAG: o-succinylbenzoate synthase [Proteobacteria bacterium]|nr:MAG: o-succinylbenzoate synthase [Pseudomonadota bacterium]